MDGNILPWDTCILIETLGLQGWQNGSGFFISTWKMDHNILPLDTLCIVCPNPHPDQWPLSPGLMVCLEIVDKRRRQC